MRVSSAIRSVVHRGTITIVFALSLTASAACADRAPKAETDSALLRDLALAAGSDTLSLSDTAASTATRAPAKKAPARSTTKAPSNAAPAGPGPLTNGLNAGTVLKLALDREICSSGARPGDKHVATITEAVVGPGGFTIPAGSRVVVEVAEVMSGPTPDSTRLTFRVRTIAVGTMSYPAKGEIRPNEDPKRAQVANSGGDKKKVIGGAIAGAIIGQVLGKDTKATVIGAAAGAAAGSVSAARGVRYQVCIPPQAALRLTLSEDLRA